MAGLLDDLYVLRKKDIPRAGAVLRDAFQHDPVWNMMFADVPDREKKLAACFETPVRHCMKYGSARATSEKLEGIAAWVPGEYADMSVRRMIRSGAFLSGMKMGAVVARRMKPTFKPMEEDRNLHMKGRSYVYIFIVGVAQEFQGKGYGSKLLRAVIEHYDRQGLPIYLETETSDNVELYKHFGFQLLKKITLPVVEQPMWEMMREVGQS